MIGVSVQIEPSTFRSVWAKLFRERYRKLQTTQTVCRTLWFARGRVKISNLWLHSYFTYCRWHKCNALCSLLRPGCLCFGSDLSEYGRFHELSPSKVVHQSPRLEWLDIGAVYFKDRLDLAHGILGVSSYLTSHLRTDSNNHCTTNTSATGVDAPLQWLYRSCTSCNFSLLSASKGY
jgi:hypothetical protein